MPEAHRPPQLFLIDTSAAARMTFQLARVALLIEPTFRVINRANRGRGHRFLPVDHGLMRSTGKSHVIGETAQYSGVSVRFLPVA